MGFHRKKLPGPFFEGEEAPFGTRDSARFGKHRICSFKPKLILEYMIRLTLVLMWFRFMCSIEICSICLGVTGLEWHLPCLNLTLAWLTKGMPPPNGTFLL